MTGRRRGATILVVYSTDVDGRELARHLAARFGGATVDVMPLETARREPLRLQARAAAADFILTMADAEEEVRSLSAEVADVLSVPRADGAV